MGVQNQAQLLFSNNDGYVSWANLSVLGDSDSRVAKPQALTFVPITVPPADLGSSFRGLVEAHFVGADRYIADVCSGAYTFFMKTRIDHATVITCQGNSPVVQEDCSVAFEEGVITSVGPTGEVSEDVGSSGLNMPPIEELKGRPLGAILIRMGKITQVQLLAALDRQKSTHGVIGRELVQLGYATEADVEVALAVQAGRKPDAFPVAGDVNVIDGRHRLVIPGLVNTHHHLFQSLTRCMPAVQNATLFEWLVALYPRWRELDYEAHKQAAMISVAELLLGGCTTTNDHHYLFPLERDVKIEAVLEAAEALGIRIHACRGSMSLGQSAGGLPPDSCVQNENVILADCQRAIDRFHDDRPLAMQRVDLAPCAPFSITPELLRATRDLAAERNVLLHTHIAETLDEERFCMDKFGVRPVEYLRQNGWLGPQVYLAHCVHLNESEIALLADTSTGVAHCPCSNMRLGSGIAPVRHMLDAGVRVGVAVDGSSSNDGGNLLAEARQALLLQRVVHGPCGMTPAEAFRLATIGGASVLGRPEIGRLEPGYGADLVIYDTRDIAWAGAIAQDPLGALMLCHPPRPERVIVAGRTVVDAGQITGVDCPQMVADFNRMVEQRFR